MEKDWRQAVVDPSATLEEAVRVITKGALRVALVVNGDGFLVGLITDGDLRRAIEQMYLIQFQRRLSDVSNPYGEGGATDKITHLLESLSIRGTRKKFFDIEFSLSDCQGGAHP